LRFSAPGGTIHLHLTVDGPQARLGVEDEGIGIPPDQLTVIFEPFTHAATVQRQHSDGFGLGLYIVRRIVERHNGQIWAESIERAREYLLGAPAALRSALRHRPAGRGRYCRQKSRTAPRSARTCRTSNIAV